MPTTWSARKIRFLTQAELRALFRVITRKRDRALFLVAYRHGLRASEVGLLQVEDLNLAQQRLTVRRVKCSLPGIYPLRADEVTALKAYLRERQSPSPGLFLSRHFHVLKHSIATHLLDAGADLSFVQDWVGHASIKNTVIYAQLTSRLRDEEARRVFASPYVV
jgi:site-specific recombinase XerD